MADGARRTGLSRIRGIYLARLAARCAVSTAGILLLVRRPEQAEILRDFLARPSPFHLLWAVWTAGILTQIFPIGWNLALGSEKQFRFRYVPSMDAPSTGEASKDALSTGEASTGKPGEPYTGKPGAAYTDAASTAAARVRGMTGRAYRVFALWAVLTAGLSWLYRAGVMDGAGLLCVSLAFYVCDLICVLIWCPFRLMMGNRCCTTCRIFNWDHLMMFSPLLPVRGFFSDSLLILSAAAFVEWEVCVFRHPERFWEGSNAALRCSRCTDRLCTQYCGERVRRAARRDGQHGTGVVRGTDSTARE